MLNLGHYTLLLVLGLWLHSIGIDAGYHSPGKICKSKCKPFSNHSILYVTEDLIFKHTKQPPSFVCNNCSDSYRGEMVSVDGNTGTVNEYLEEVQYYLDAKLACPEPSDLRLCLSPTDCCRFASNVPAKVWFYTLCPTPAYCGVYAVFSNESSSTLVCNEKEYVSNAQQDNGVYVPMLPHSTVYPRVSIVTCTGSTSVPAPKCAGGVQPRRLLCDQFNPDFVPFYTYDINEIHWRTAPAQACSCDVHRTHYVEAPNTHANGAIPRGFKLNVKELCPNNGWLYLCRSADRSCCKVHRDAIVGLTPACTTDGCNYYASINGMMWCDGMAKITGTDANFKSAKFDTYVVVDSAGCSRPDALWAPHCRV